MAKKRKKRKSRSSGSSRSMQPFLSDEVKQSLLSIGVIVLAIIGLLAFFGSAGTVGESIDELLALAFGWDRWLFLVIMLVFGIGTIFPDKKIFSAASWIGLGLFFLGFNGLFNILAIDQVPTSQEVMAAGGYIGVPMQGPVANILGSAGSAVVCLAFIIVAVLLVFNVSLHALVTAPKALRSRRELNADEADVDTYEEEVEEDEQVEDEDDEEESRYVDTAPLPVQGTAEESVMTSSRRRKMEVPIDLLDDKSSEAKSGDIDRSKEIIRKTFENFNIDVEMTDVRVGPSVTQFALRPAQGVKLSRIVALQNDLALALAAHPIRIEAPIPGKSQVGIEVPNQTVGRVGLRELIASNVFKTRKTDLTAPLGKDVGGIVTSFEVDSAPHALVAGATGSGKSVCLNTIIVSLLYQNGPDDLKFIFVDPKRVELGRYEGIPHLLVPPIVKVEEAINALKWGVREMERRLDHLAKAGVRDIDSYNKKSKERMPKIVIVIDELADLMSQNKRDVEAVIVRIAQMARAAGIHLVLATQRPSVDVITGTIKANIPTRLAFAVASQVDSKTILDMSGAEKLLGRGDMLISSPKYSKPKRLQGAFVSDEEIARIVKFLKQEGEPDYNYQVTEDARVGGTSISAEDADPVLNEAIQEVIQTGKASTSYLQRRLRLGYSRAARIVDMMEEMGVIGPQSGSKPREVLVDSWPPGGAAQKAPLNEVATQARFDEPVSDDDRFDEELNEAFEEEYDEDES